MATFTKPATVPRWADDLTNNLEPPEAKKDEGWLFEEIPASNFENQRSQLIGQWFKWIDERFDDAVGGDSMVLVDPAGPAQMASWVGGQFIAGLAADGITMNHGGAIKSIEFDDPLNMLRYNVTTDLFEIRCNSATAAFQVNPLESRANTRMVVGPGATAQDVGDLSVENGLGVNAGIVNPGPGQGIFSANINVGGAPAIPDAAYSRFFGGVRVGTSTLVPVAGTLAAEVLDIGSQGGFELLSDGTDNPNVRFNGVADRIYVDTDNNLDMHFDRNSVEEFGIFQGYVEANAYDVRNTGGQINSPYEVGRRNQISLAVSATFVGPAPETGSRPWNLDSITLLATGRFEVTADVAILDDATCIATSNGNDLAKAYAFSTAAGVIEVRTTNTSGTLTTHQFHLIVVSG